MGRPVIHVKRAYEAPEAADGYRILVDGIWPRGVSKAALNADLWARDLAPSASLRKWFGHDPERWDEFRRRYFAELRRKPRETAQVHARALEGPVTLVYGARDPRHNQAVALKEFLERGNDA